MAPRCRRRWRGHHPSASGVGGLAQVQWQRCPDAGGGGLTQAIKKFKKFHVMKLPNSTECYLCQYDARYLLMVFVTAITCLLMMPVTNMDATTQIRIFTTSSTSKLNYISQHHHISSAQHHTPNDHQHNQTTIFTHHPHG